MLRPITPTPFAAPAFKVLSYAASTRVPIGISNDRKTFYARGSTSGTDAHILYQSVDDGTTWTTTVAATTFGTSGSLQSVQETDDGEIIVNKQGGSATPGFIYKSTGWATSHTTATFALTLTSIGGWFDGRWAVNSFTFGNDKLVAGTSKYGVVCEYGTQTSVTFASGNADTTDLTKARRVFWTENYGATWTQILDLASYFPNATGLHCHSAAYDPYWDRIWLTWGDTQTNTVGSGNIEIIYSDDHGVTWQTIAVANGGDGAQSTSIGFFSDCIIFGSDNRPGVLRIPRAGYRSMGPAQYPSVAWGNTGAAMIAQTPHRNRFQNGAPMLLGFQGSGSTLYPTLYYSPDGRTWHELWRDSFYPGSGLTYAYGPSLSGRVLARQSGGGGFNLIGEIEDPGGGLVLKKFGITGDGTTTVFTVLHGLGYKPNRLYSWDMRNNAGTYTLTSDATSITVTFTTAPASAALVLLDLRYI